MGMLSYFGTHIKHFRLKSCFRGRYADLKGLNFLNFEHLDSYIERYVNDESFVSNPFLYSSEGFNMF